MQPVTAAKYITIIDIEDDPIPAQSNGDIKIDSFEKGMSKLKVSLRDSRFQEAKHKESKTSDDSPIKSRKLRRQRTPDQEASFDTGKKKTVTEWQDKSNSRRCQSNLSHMSPTLLLDVPRLHFKEMKKDEFIKKFNIQTPKACSLPLTYEFRKMFQEVL